jgi:hypothetical protein
MAMKKHHRANPYISPPKFGRFTWMTTNISPLISLFIWLKGEQRFSEFQLCGSNATGLIIAICGHHMRTGIGCKMFAQKLLPAASLSVKSKEQ